MDQKHEVVARTLMRRIFNRSLGPGDKLPTEKQLSEDMNVDRTSLRVALKLLESMRLLDIRQGDGMYVRDYLKDAGIDFLRMLITHEAEEDRPAAVDAYLADEATEMFNMIMPAMLATAAVRFSTRDHQAFMNLLDEEAGNVSDPGKWIDINIRQQDFIARSVDNTVLLLFFNSFRPLRRLIMIHLITMLEPEMLAEHNRTKRELMKAYLADDADSALQYLSQLNEHLELFRKVIRRSWSNPQGRAEQKNKKE